MQSLTIRVNEKQLFFTFVLLLKSIQEAFSYYIYTLQVYNRHESSFILQI